jgi:hypothetical protein
MSARQRKRLQQTSAASLPGLEKLEDQDDGSNNDVRSPFAPSRSGFHLLIQESSSDSESERDVTTHGADAVVSVLSPATDKAQVSSAECAPGALVSASCAKHSKKHPQDTNASKPSNNVLSEDVILKELAPLANMPCIAIFKPNMKFLNADSEVLRMLAEGTARNSNGLQREARSAKGRRTVLVSPEFGWMPMPTRTAGGMSMIRRGEWRQVVEFALDASDEYVRMQHEYHACVESMDPRAIIAFLRIHPYCMEAMLDLAQYYRTTRQHEAAAKLLRQCVYVLETAFHPLFRPWEGCCAVRHTTENELFYRVLWQAMMAGGRAAAPRTAFEIAKLMLYCSNAAAVLPAEAVVVRDPMRILLVVDHFAARAAEWRFILTLTAGPAFGLCLAQSSVPCVWLPGLAFARSLALFHTEVLNEAPPLRAPNHADTASNADLCSDLSYTTYGSLRMLIRSLLVFPQMLTALANQLNLTTASVGTSDALQTTINRGRVIMPPIVADVADMSCCWNRVLAHPVFRNGADHGEDDNNVRVLCAAFAQRNSVLFRAAGVLRWLYTGAVLAAHMFERTRGGVASFALEPTFASILHATFDSSDHISAETCSSFLIFDTLYGTQQPFDSAIMGARAEISHYSRVIISGMQITSLQSICCWQI